MQLVVYFSRRKKIPPNHLTDLNQTVFMLILLQEKKEKLCDRKVKVLEIHKYKNHTII